jgi:hypothetical protein
MNGEEALDDILSRQGGTKAELARKEVERLRNIAKHADMAEEQAARLSAGVCEHLVGDDHGNPTCKLRMELEQLEKSNAVLVRTVERSRAELSESCSGLYVTQDIRKMMKCKICRRWMLRDADECPHCGSAYE